MRLASAAHIFFDARGRLSRLQALKCSLIIVIFSALLFASFANFYDVSELTDATLFLCGAILVGSGLVLLTKRLNDLRAPFGSTEIIIACAIALYWLAFANVNRVMESVSIEAIAQNPEPIFESTSSSEKAQDDPALGSLRGIVVSLEALDLNLDQKARMSRAETISLISEIVAMVSGIALVFVLFFVPGTRGENKYGPDPLGTN